MENEASEFVERAAALLQDGVEALTDEGIHEVLFQLNEAINLIQEERGE